MAVIQHRDARKLLRVISKAVQQGRKDLTYRSAAKLMGRVPPEKHSRAVAQMCDLLDAAAALAGVPLLALVVVRDLSGEINRKAWKNERGPRRDAIIKRSLRHRFSKADFAAISNAIDDLGDRGNRRAWKYLASLYPGDLLYRRLTAQYKNVAPKLNAIDDLGTDSPDRAKTTVWAYARDPKVRAAVLKRAKGRCEYCGEFGFLKSDGSRYLESHHIIALAGDGTDRLTNVIALCPNDHRKAHFSEDAEKIETKMIKLVRSITSERVIFPKVPTRV